MLRKSSKLDYIEDDVETSRRWLVDERSAQTNQRSLHS